MKLKNKKYRKSKKKSLKKVFKLKGRSAGTTIVKTGYPFPDIYRCKYPMELYVPWRSFNSLSSRCDFAIMSTLNQSIIANTVGSFLTPVVSKAGALQDPVMLAMKNIYKEYRVYGIGYDITVVNPSVQKSIVIYTAPLTAYTSGFVMNPAINNVQTLSGARRYMLNQITNGDHTIAHIKGYVSGTINSNATAIQSRSDLIGNTTTGNPTVMWGLQVSAETVDGSTLIATDLDVTVRLKYYVEFTNKIMIA